MSSEFKISFMFPEWNEEKKFYFWPQLVVRNTLQKGLGVFAKEDICEGTLIPYLGLRLDKKQYQDLHKKTDFYTSKDLHYIIQSDTHTYINGHPNFDTHHLYLTSLLNEPEPGQRANCRSLPLRPKQLGLGVMTTRLIAKGEELSMHYGYAYYRDYSIGQDCEDAHYHPKKFVSVKDKETFDRFLFLVHVANRVCRPK